jgi:hypothetical protein
VRFPLSRRTTCVEVAPAFAIRLPVSRFSFCWDRYLYKRQKRYLGCKQRFRNAVNDRIGLEREPPGSP